MHHPSHHRSRTASPAQIAALVAIALAGIVLARSTPAAEPLRFEAAAGVCKYGLAANGIWRNDAYPTEIDRRPACFQLGASRIEGRVGESRAGWRLAYADLGKLTADNQFAMLDDQQFERFDASQCDSVTRKNCVGRGVISQTARGVMLTGLVERALGPVTLGLDAGAFVYHGRFKSSVSLAASGQHVADLDWSGWRATPVMAVTATYRALFASVRGFGSIHAAEHNCAGCSGITAGSAWSATVGIQVPLQ